MCARTVMRPLLIVLAGTLAVPLVASVVVLRGPVSVSHADDGGPAVIATVAVGIHPEEVAVNPNTNRNVTLPYNNTVSVIDGTSNTVVATVAVGNISFGVAVNPNTNLIYATNWYPNTVSVIDGTSNTVVASVAVGSRAQGVAVNPDRNRIYVANASSSSTVSVIDGASNSVVATVAVGSYPYGVAVNPNTNRIYVANFMDDTVSVIEDEDIHLEIDMDPTNGSGPCNPVDTTRNVTSGQTYTVAVCLTSAGDGESPAALQFDLLYDDTLNTCVTSTDTNLDSNPDANAGNTTFTTPDLGPWFDCTGVGTAPPNCDADPAAGPGHSDAFLTCVQMSMASGPPTLPVGDTISAPVAEVTFTATASVGVDSMSFSRVSFADYATNNILDCDTVGFCLGAYAFVNETPTPTATFTPTDTPTPSPTATATLTPRPATPTPPHPPGVGGKVMLPPAAIAAESHASAGGSGWSGGAYALLGGVCGVLAITVAGTVVSKRRSGG